MLTNFNHENASAIVASHAYAVSAGLPVQATLSARHGAILGQELMATIARCEQDRRRCHESALDEIAVDEDRAVAELAILEAVPALDAAIGMLAEDEVSEIWSEFGPAVDEDEDA